jgi:glycine cleavage system H protein
MEDRFGTHPVFALKPGRHKLPVQVSGFTFFPERYYSSQHIWARAMDRAVKLGFDDLAATLAVDATAVELPRVGRSLKKDEMLVRITAGDRSIEFSAPMDGVVRSVNSDLIDDPRLIWKSPYERGWLIMVERHDPVTVSRLLSGPAAQVWFTEQATALSTFLMEKAGETARQRTDTPRRALFDDSPLIRRIIGRHWNRVRKILLPAGEKARGRG